MLISTTDQHCTLDTTDDFSTKTTISVPQPHSRLVEGSVLNERDRQRKKELVLDILKSQENLSFGLIRKGKQRMN